MSKIAVVFWSGTGNTEAMADAVAEGAKGAGAEVSVFNVTDFSADKVDEFDAIAFGCPAMGAETLEDSEFDLFGSYGWGDGEWMRTWEETCNSAGAVLAAESVICNDAPDDEATANCNALGAALAG